MKVRIATLFFAGALLAQLACAQTAPVVSTAPRPAAPPTPNYFDPAILDPYTVIIPPPVRGSAEEKADLAEVHRAQQAASPTELKAAQADAAEEDMFIFATVLGPGFRADALPVTAAFSNRVVSDSRLVNLTLKNRYARPRPPKIDSTLTFQCGNLTEPSYPSGHTMIGYLTGYVLAQMVPEKAQEILARTGQYAQRRLTCGAHYPTDVEAGREVAMEMFGYMLANPRFERDLAAARAETRAALHLEQR